MNAKYTILPYATLFYPVGVNMVYFGDSQISKILKHTKMYWSTPKWDRQIQVQINANTNTNINTKLILLPFSCTPQQLLTDVHLCIKWQHIFILECKCLVGFHNSSLFNYILYPFYSYHTIYIICI